jgi:hypothetical protein
MEELIPPPAGYPYSPEDWEDGLGRCESCEGSGIATQSGEGHPCEYCNGNGYLCPVLPPDEQLPALSDSARAPGTADWWKEQMRSHLSGVYEATGHARPNAAANQIIRMLERLAASQ